MIFENIPDEIVVLPQWVNWRYVPRKDGGKPTKPPYQPNGKLAESNNPLTWSTFPAVKDAVDRFDGIGFVLTRESEIVGLDFDHCRCPAFDTLDPEIGGGLNMVLPHVSGHVRSLDSYTELSPTGQGLHVLLKGKLPVDGKKKGNFEAYQSRHYFTMTGDIVAGCLPTIECRQAELDSFFDTIFRTPTDPREQERRPKTITSLAGWWDRLEKAFQSKKGPEIRLLWEGNYSAYASHSEADLALCSNLAFWLDGDAVVIDQAFRSSGLMRDKWDKKHYGDGRTYGQATIDQAIDGCQAFYEDRSKEGYGIETKKDVPQLVNWPAPLDQGAFYGVAGEWVEKVSPNTEADPAALLFQFLVAFGNIAGRTPYFMVEATEHHSNEFLLLVGPTSSGRKGTSWDHVRKVTECVDPDWNFDCIKSGLTSGEGLIYHVRDPQEKKKGKNDDEGVEDKRLVAYESEFATVLKIIERKDNTLSATMRDAWDRGHLRTLAKNSPIKATNAHISIISHVTREELRMRLSDTESFNGFANRFIFACVKRSKLLPEGGGTVDLSGILPRVKKAAEFSQTVKEIRRDEEARNIWRAVYEKLTRERPGIMGGVLSRDAAHVTRLSMIYALLDCSRLIRQEHLLAALACWEYVEASASFIFGSMTGDPMADKIYQAAYEAGDEGITRTVISTTLFQRNQKSERIDQAIKALETLGKIRVQTIETLGRNETRIFATK